MIEAAVTGATGPLAKQIGDLTNRLGVTHGAVLTMLRTIGEQEVPFERLTNKLAEIATQYKSAVERMATLDPHDPITGDLVERAKAAMTAGQFDEADELFRQAEHAEIAAVHRALELAEQARAAADKRMLRAAADRGLRGDIAMSKLHYLDAAQHFSEVIDLVPAGHPDEKGRLLVAKGNALEQHGDERGDNAALESAIKNYRLASLECTRERVPLDWARAQGNLGNALVTLGERESSTAWLEEAVVTYHAVLAVYTRDQAPLRWATTQNNLGNALMRLGERESGTTRLEGRQPPIVQRSQSARVTVTPRPPG
jgi:tetratricopeptide (TPR) repeat protein